MEQTKKQSAVGSTRLLADVVSYATDQAKQFRQCAGHHAEHNRGAEAVAYRAAEILDRIIADIKSARQYESEGRVVLQRLVGRVTLLACALHDARKALGRAFDAAEDCGLEKTKTEIALTLADVSAAADKTDALVAQAND